MRVEYYRGWPDGRWDTDYLEVPVAIDDIEGEIRRLVYHIMPWPHETPVFVGLYHQPPQEVE